MKLYDAKLAPNPRRVRIFIAEKSMPGIEIIPVDLVNREHKSETFLKKNVMGQIPVLELSDGTTISESVSICRYLEELQPNPPLFGRTALERALIDQWNRRMETFVHGPIAMTWAHTHPLTAAVVKQNKEWGESNRAAIPSRLAFVDQALEGKEYIAGPYSIADITLQAMLDFGIRMLKIEMPAELTRLSAWHARVSARPSSAA